MKKSLRIGAGIAAAAALTLGPMAAANATPWNGSDYIYFQHGEWELSNFDFEDVYLIDPANSSTPSVYQYTDLWDGAGQFYVSLDDWSTSDQAYAPNDSDMDITDDAATGDKLISAPIDGAGKVWDGKLDISGEMRIYSAGDLVRSVYFIKNTTSTPVTASFQFYTDFGSSGEIYNYQNQSDSVLAVPANEDSNSADALNGAGVQWTVHSNHTPGSTNDCDAPGAAAYGLPGAASPASLDFYDDEYSGYYNDVVIPAGATIAIASFYNWTPSELLADSYSGGPCTDSQMNAYADAATTAAAEFNTFSGRLTNGLTGYNVINWGDLSTPSLPDTGASDTALLSAGVAGVLALAAGVTILVIRRRARA